MSRKNGRSKRIRWRTGPMGQPTLPPTAERRYRKLWYLISQRGRFSLTIGNGLKSFSYRRSIGVGLENVCRYEEATL